MMAWYWGAETLFDKFTQISSCEQEIHTILSVSIPKIKERT